MKSPAYYVAAFGKPDPPDKDTEESGRFPLGRRGADTPGDRGDVLLLYSTGSNADDPMSAPGIGIVLTKTREAIFYRYLPFSSPIPKDRIDRAFTEEDRKKLSGLKNNTYWLVDITGDSFSDAVRDAAIDWP